MTDASKSHWTPWKNGWDFTSSAPPLDPRRRYGSLARSWLMRLVSSVLCRPMYSGSCIRTLWNVSLRFRPRNGVTPYAISYVKTPRAHQSTAKSWPSPRTTSGETYSTVPTKEFDISPALILLRRLTGKTRADLAFFSCFFLSSSAAVLESEEERVDNDDSSIRVMLRR